MNTLHGFALRPTLCVLAGGVLVLALSGCGSARRGEPLVGPLQASEASVQRGRIAFDRHCYKCHAEGEGAMGPGMNDKPLPRMLIRMQVRLGLGTMPAFSREEIDDQELDDIVDYLVALRQQGR